MYMYVFMCVCASRRYDDTLKLEFGTVSGDFMVASSYTHARRQHFEELLQAAYEGVREGVRLSGADQPFVDLAEAVRVRVYVYICMYV